MTATLLDVNLLIALTWPNHVHHDLARRWFADNSAAGWATTPVTELGFVRVSSNKKVIPSASTPGTALGVLRSLCALPGHEFWPDDCRLVNPPIKLDRLGAYRQVTDVHLVALAVARGARLATLDRGVVEAVDPDHRHAVEMVLSDRAGNS